MTDQPAEPMTAELALTRAVKIFPADQTPDDRPAGMLTFREVCAAREGLRELVRVRKALEVASAWCSPSPDPSVLVEALEPFANAYDEIDDQLVVDAAPVHQSPLDLGLVFGHFRKAADVVTAWREGAGQGQAAADSIGAAELAVGKQVYRRIERLMGAAGGANGGELVYLAALVEQIEELGFEAVDGGASPVPFPPPPASSPQGAAWRPIDGNELWELLFAIMQGGVPEDLDTRVLAELAESLNELMRGGFSAPPAVERG